MERILILVLEWYTGSVRRLEFGDYFNQKISGYIPYGVEHIIFSALFNKSLKNGIPASVRKLEFRQCLTMILFIIHMIMNL